MRVTARVSSRKRRRRILKRAKGFVGGRRRLIRTATEAVIRAEAYAYRHRRLKKREFRRLWITRLSAAAGQHGADVDAVDAEKRSALYIAAENGHADVVKVLCQYGADVDNGNTEETSSALYIAAEEGHVDVVKLLCQYGADVNAVVKVRTTTQIEELTPLYVVACRGDVDITKVMIENGADVNALVQVEYQDDPYVCFRVRVLRLLI